MGDRGPAMSFDEALNVLQGMFSGWSRDALGQMLQVGGAIHGDDDHP